MKLIWIIIRKIIPPPFQNFIDEQLYSPDIANFLVELRCNILNITIDQLVYYFSWTNEKYYQQIVNGYKDKNGVKKFKQPTIKYLFTSLNYAMNNFSIFKNNKKEINELIYKYLLKF